MNDVTLITRTLSIKPERLAMIAEAIWNRYPEHGATVELPYDPLFELAVCKFIKRKIQGFHLEVQEIDYKNATEYTKAHVRIIFRTYEAM